MPVCGGLPVGYRKPGTCSGSSQGEPAPSHPKEASRQELPPGLRQARLRDRLAVAGTRITTPATKEYLHRSYGRSRALVPVITEPVHYGAGSEARLERG